MDTLEYNFNKPVKNTSNLYEMHLKYSENENDPEQSIVKKEILDLKPGREVFFIDSFDACQEYLETMQESLKGKVELNIFEFKDDFFDKLKEHPNMPSHIFFSSRHGNDVYDPDLLETFIMELIDVIKEKQKNGNNDKKPEIVFVSTDSTILDKVTKDNREKYNSFINHIVPKDWGSIHMSIEKAYRDDAEDVSFEQEDSDRLEKKKILEDLDAYDRHIVIIEDEQTILDLLKTWIEIKGSEYGLEKISLKEYTNASDAYKFFELAKNNLNGGFSKKKFVVILDKRLGRDDGEILYQNLTDLLKGDGQYITFIANSNNDYWNQKMSKLDNVEYCQPDTINLKNIKGAVALAFDKLQEYDKTANESNLL